MRTRDFVILALSAAACMGQTTQIPATTMGAAIFGYVQTDEPVVERGKPIGFTWVTLIRQPSSVKDKITPFSVGRAAPADGSFGFTGLEPGVYRICAQLGKSTMVNPCEWGEPPPVITLQAEQIVKNVFVTMQYGVAVSIRVNDPQQLLVQHEGKTQGAHLLIGVGDANGMFHSALVIATDKTGRDHQIVIPANTRVNLVVKSKFFQLADATGATIAPDAAAAPIVALSGQAPPAKVVVTVTGTAKP
jgi:hypothetical protein